MKLAGLVLLPAGWVIVISAVVLFPPSVSRWVFVLAGLGVEAAGLALAFVRPRGPRERKP